MATITFFKSATDDGGAKGAALVDGGVDDLCPSITSQNRLVGFNFHRKIWYEADADLTIMCSLANLGQFNSCFFVTTGGGNDVAGDITGSEDRFGAMNIVSNTVNTVKVSNNPKWTLVRNGDHAHVGSDIVTVGTVTDNGDGTSDITFSPDIPTANHAGTFFVSVLGETFTSGTAKPFWVEVDVIANAPISSNRDSHQFMSLY